MDPNKKILSTLRSSPFFKFKSVELCAVEKTIKLTLKYSTQNRRRVATTRILILLQYSPTKTINRTRLPQYFPWQLAFFCPTQIPTYSKWRLLFKSLSRDLAWAWALLNGCLLWRVALVDRFFSKSEPQLMNCVTYGSFFFIASSAKMIMNLRHLKKHTEKMSTIQY